MSIPDFDPAKRLKQVPWHLWFGAFAVVLGPVYIVESGNPQPTDWFTVLFLTAVLIRRNGRLNIPRHATGFVALLFTLGLWILLVNTSWSWYLQSPLGMKAAAHYGYNFSVVIVFIGLFHEHGTRLHVGLVHLLFASLVLQVLAVPFLWDTTKMRQALLFNNPNQLAVYATISSSILLAVSQRLKFSVRYQTIFYSLAFFLTVLSVSRGGIASMLLLFGFIGLKKPTTLIPVVALLVLVLWLLSDQVEFLDFFSKRIVAGAENDGQRGHERLASDPRFMLLGAGEYTSSFVLGVSLEVHSSIGTMVFSYGIVGLALWAGLHFEILRNAPPRVLYSLLPPAVYGLSHNGLRMTLYWIHLAVLMTLWTSRLVYRHDRGDLDLENRGVPGRPPVAGWPVPGEPLRRGGKR